jgi:hypothetical protein
MTTRYGSTFTGSTIDGTVPGARIDGGRNGAKRRVIREVFDLSTATFASGDLLYLGRLPTGGYFDGGRIVASATMGASATIAIGSVASAAKYRAAAIFTAVDTPTGFGLASAFAQAALTAPEDVYATIATANLPAAGTLVIELDYLVVA